MDRAITVSERSDFDHRRSNLRAHVSKELAERPFRLTDARLHDTFNHHLGMGRHHQVNRFTFHDFDRFSSEASRYGELINTIRHTAHRRHGDIRRRADHHRNIHRTVLGLVFLMNDRGVLGCLDQHPDPVRSLNHSPINATILNAGLRVLLNHTASGQIRCSVFSRSPGRNGESGQIYLFSFPDIFFARRGFRCHLLYRHPVRERTHPICMNCRLVDLSVHNRNAKRHRVHFARGPD